MIRCRSSRGLVALVVLVSWFAPTLRAQDGHSPSIVASLRPAADGGSHLMIELAGELDGGKVDEIIIGLPDDIADQIGLGQLPKSWSGAIEDNLLKLKGEGLEAVRNYFRIDLGSVPGEDLSNLSFDLRSQGKELLTEAVDLTRLPELGIVESLEGLLALPSEIVPGEAFEFTALDLEKTAVDGVWKIAGMDAVLENIEIEGEDLTRFSVVLPDDLLPGDPISVLYVDPYGLEQVRVDDAENVSLSIGDPPVDDRPFITGCTPRVFRGRTACICGYYPESSQRRSLLLDGTSLGYPLAASSRSVVVRIPESVAPGPHKITGPSSEGFGPTQSADIVVLAVIGEVDFERILEGGSTPLRLTILGTEEKLPILLENRTPETIRLSSGLSKTLISSGGPNNTLVETVTGIVEGPFGVYYRLDEDPCPCKVPGPSVADAGDDDTPPPRPPDTPDGDPRPKPPKDEPDGDKPPPWDPPLEKPPPDTFITPRKDPPPRHEEDKRKTPSCCGLRDRRVVFPYTKDPRAIPAIRTAPRSPAVAGIQVVLPTGAYFHNESDLFIESVGFPFEWTRHYVGDLDTEEGGLLGYRWDFSYNKTIVPVSDTQIGEGLQAELIGFESSVIHYFNGHGRGGVYMARPSDTELRQVLNFGVTVPFEAYVTTYKSPRGEFHEIQRYVLTTPEDHPFGDHPNVSVETGEAIFYVLREKNGMRYIFNCHGQVIYILDPNDFTSVAGELAVNRRDSVRATLRYNDGRLNPLTQSPVLASVEDASGHVVSIEYVDIDQGLLETNLHCVPRTGNVPIPRVKEIRGGGAVITYSYRNDDDVPVLEEVTFDYGDVVTRKKYVFDSENHLLKAFSPNETVKGASGSPFIDITYDADGRVETQSQGDSLRYRFTYLGDSRIDVHDGRSNSEYELEFDSEFYMIARHTLTPDEPADGGPWTTRYVHNASTQVTEVRHPRGNLTRFAYDESNERVTAGTIRNRYPTFTYANNLSAGNLLSVTRSRGSLPDSLGPTPITTSTTYEPLFNRLASSTDPLGNESIYEYSYDFQGDMENPVLARPPALIQPDNSTLGIPPVSYEYTSKGQLARSATGTGKVTTYTYEPRTGYLERVDMPGGAFRALTVDRLGRVEFEQSGSGAIRYERNGRGEVVTKIVDPDGFNNRTTFEYDLDGNTTKTSITVKDNFVSHDLFHADTLVYGPDTIDSTVTVVDVEYNLLDLAVEETVTGDRVSMTTNWTYDRFGRVSSLSEPSPTGRLISRFQYDPRGLLYIESKFDGADRIQRRCYGYDRNGNMTGQSEGLSCADRAVHYELDAFDRTISMVDPLGTRSLLSYDAASNLVQSLVFGSDGSQDGDHPVLLSRTDFRYNSNDQPIEIVRHLLDGSGGTEWQRRYFNEDMFPSRLEIPGGSVTEYEYDEAGNMVLVTDPDGNTTNLTYDIAGNQTSVINHWTEEQYDVETRQWSRTPDSSRVQFLYDTIGRLTRYSDGSAPIVYLNNSTNKLRASFTKEVGWIDFRYDGLGRLLVQSRPGNWQQFAYFDSGQIREFESPSEHSRFMYDANGLVATKTNVRNGGVTRTERNEFGDPIRVTDPNGTTVVRTFNAVGLPLSTEITYGSASTTAPAVGGGTRSVSTLSGPKAETYRYDGLARLVAGGTDQDISTRLVYDGLDRQVVETQNLKSLGQTIHRTFAADGSSVRIRYPELAGSPIVESTIDKLGRVREILLDDQPIASYTYTGPDRIASRLLANGVATYYGYGEQQALTRIDVVGPPTDQPGFRLWSGEATYRSGQPVQTTALYQGDAFVTPRIASTEFRYDEFGRNTATVTTSRTTPGSGAPGSVSVSGYFTSYESNRPAAVAEVLVDETTDTPHVLFAKSSTYTYNQLGLVGSTSSQARTSMGDNSLPVAAVDQVAYAIEQDDDYVSYRQDFEYDANGNLIKDDRNIYGYDYENRLTYLEELPSQGRAHTNVVEYYYDVVGRRVFERPLLTDLRRFSTWYVYDGGQIVAEIAYLPGGLPSSATLRARYILGARPGERLRMDRKPEEDPDASTSTAARELISSPVTPFYLHEGLTGQIELMTDGNGVAHTAANDVTATMGGSYAPLDEMRFVQGTRIRAPYVGWNTRIDSYAGIKYDEISGRQLHDIHLSRQLAEQLDMQVLRGSITAAQNKGAVMLAAITSSALMPIVAIPAGLMNAGLGASFAYVTSTPYSLDDAALAFAEGSISGAVGAVAAPAGSGAVRALAGNYVADFTTGTAIEMAWHGTSFGQAAANNASNALFGMGMNIASGIATRGLLGVTSAIARRSSRISRGSQDVASSASAGKSRTFKFLSGLNAVWESFRIDKWDFVPDFKNNEIRAFEKTIVHELENGTELSKLAAQLLKDGKIKVKFRGGDHFNPGTYGEISWRNRKEIFINSDIYQPGTSTTRQAASTVLHEVVHALGGGEISAHIAQAQFLRARMRKRLGKKPLTGDNAPFLDAHHRRLVNTYERGLFDMLRYIGRMEKLNPTGPYPADKLFSPRSYVPTISPLVHARGGWAKLLNLKPHQAKVLRAALFGRIRSQFDPNPAYPDPHNY